MLFQDEGHQVAIALTGTTALAAAEANPPDVLLLDLRLPDYSGLDVLQKIKKTAAGGHGRHDDGSW